MLGVVALWAAGGIADGVADALLAVLFFAAGVVVLVFGMFAAFVRLLMPPGTGLAALLMLWVSLLAFLPGFQALTVVLATAGVPGSALHAVLTNQGQSSATGTAALGCVGLIAGAVVGVPQLLRANGRAMRDVREPARTLLPSWLAAVAGVLTWVYVFLLRFGEGALSGRSFSTLAVAAGGAAVAALLMPAYRFLATVCWERGLENVIDPARWRDSVSEVVAALSVPAPAAGADAPVTPAEEPYPA